MIFSDAGRFRASQTSGATPKVLRSVGAGVRLNAAGFVFELDGVRPFDRRSAGWTFFFNLRPGY